MAVFRSSHKKYVPTYHNFNIYFSGTLNAIEYTKKTLYKVSHRKENVFPESHTLNKRKL